MKRTGRWNRIITWVHAPWVLAIPVCAFLGACGSDPGSDVQSVVLGAPPAPALPACISGARPPEVDEIARGLDTPWAMAQAPDGRIFLTERPGRIRVIEGGALSEAPWAVVPVSEEGELGLMGITLDPAFRSNGHVYVVGRFLADSESRFPAVLGPLVRRIRARIRAHDEGTVYVSHVERWTDGSGRGTRSGRVVTGLPAAAIHGGGALGFDHEGRLLYGVGDALRPWGAQEDGSVLGKVMAREPGRMHSGSPPGLPDEIVGSGVRNPQGIGIDPEAGLILFTDHGPSGLEPEARRQGRDELNLLVDGGNYGWPIEAGRVPDPGYLPPLVEWTPAIAPAGIALSRDTGTGDLIAWITALRGQALHRVVLEPDDSEVGWRARCEDRLLVEEYGRLRAVLAAEDGSIWVATSNRDGRGRARDADDRVLRVRFPVEMP
jgi:aldose sugar dehydrogenase